MNYPACVTESDVATGRHAGSVRVYDSGCEAAWSNLLVAIGGYDFYHTLDYHRLEEVRMGGRAELIVYAEGEDLVAIPLLFSEIKIAGKAPFDRPRFAARSVYGYVGWLTTPRTTLPVLGRFGRRLEEYLRARGVVFLFSRMHPLLPRRHNELLVGRLENAGTTIGIDLRLGLDAYTEGLSKGHSYEIRKLREMGCEVTRTNGPEFIAEFHELYTATMTRLQASAEYFYAREYLEKMVSSRQFETWTLKAELGGRVCAMAMFIKCGRMIQYHLSCSQAGVVKFPATKLLIDEACHWALNSGCAWLHLGGGLGGRKDSLYDFKAGFGGQPVPFYVWKCIFRDHDYADLCDLAGHKTEEASSYFPAFFTPAS